MHILPSAAAAVVAVRVHVLHAMTPDTIRLAIADGSWPKVTVALPLLTTQLHFNGRSERLLSSCTLSIIGMKIIIIIIY